jgi:hypothetical protein
VIVPPALLGLAVSGILGFTFLLEAVLAGGHPGLWKSPTPW